MIKNRPFVVGLTGSIGMGKSTTAAMFADLGAIIWDADAAVARLYASGGAGVTAVQNLYPAAIIDGAVSRDALKRWISDDKSALGRLEQAIHPLVALDRVDFLNTTVADVVVLEIPLLFETGQTDDMNLICVASAPPDIQRQRVLARPGMTEQQFNLILSKQMPDAEKCARADFVIPTQTLESARIAVQNVMRQIRKTLANA